MLYERVHSLAAGGDDAAIAQEERWLHAQARNAYKGHIRTKHGRLHLSARRAVARTKTTVPASKTVRARSVTGEMIQMALPMYDLTFAQLRDTLSKMMGQQNRLLDSITAISRALELATRVPSANSPKEALASLGMTVEEWIASA